jgi:hypothetical protein
MTAVMRWFSAAGVAGLLIAGSARAQAGPSGPCRLIFENTPTTRLHSVKLPSTKYNTYIGGGVIAHCPVQNLTLISDSAESYGDEQLLYMIDHVHYIEPRADVHSDRATYYEVDARLIADGHVHAKLPSGTTMTGKHVDYLRAVPNVRAQALMTATLRPHMNLVQRDSTGKPTEPVGVDANTIVSQNDSLIFASGVVDIVRSDVDAHGDSAYMDQGTEFTRLMRQPVIHGRKGRPFTLRGIVIDLYSHQRQLQRTVAYTKGDAVSQELHLMSDTIDLRTVDDKLERAYAWGPSRAHAITPDRDILADSIDAHLPNQVLRQVRSIRKAYAQSTPDTTKIRTKEKDWMKADTIIAYFDSTDTIRVPDSTSVPKPGGGVSSAQDTTRETAQPEVRTVVGIKDARAFYQMAPKDTTLRRPALNYTRGRLITIHMLHKAVQLVTVVDSAQGVYMEPVVPDTGDTTGLKKGKKGKKGKNGKGGASATAVTADSSTARPARKAGADSSSTP